MLAEADALLLPEDAAELRGAELAQRCRMMQGNIAVEMRRHMRDGGIGPSRPARAMQGGQGLVAWRRDQGFARRPWPAPARQIDQRADALAQLPV